MNVRCLRRGMQSRCRDGTPRENCDGAQYLNGSFAAGCVHYQCSVLSCGEEKRGEGG